MPILPLLYVVVATRADERCTEGDLIDVLDWHHEFLPEALFVVVEWGDPIKGREPLHSALRNANRRAAVVCVPSVLADANQSPGVWGEYGAKNVGLRLVAEKLVGENDPLVIVTNLDCYFSEALCAAVRREALAPQPNLLYRAPRYTYHLGTRPPDVREPWNAPLWSRLDIGKWGGEAAGDFCGMTLSSWSNLMGYAESAWRQGHLDSELTDRALYHGRVLFDFGHGCPVFHRAHKNKWPMNPASLDAPYTAVDARGLRKHAIRMLCEAVYEVVP
jgi:hypothetical protein